MKIAVFASGGGSNFASILQSIDAGKLPAEVVLCVSNKGQSGAIQKATTRGIPTLVIHSSDYDTDEEYASSLLHGLANSGTEFIALAGYMRKIPAIVVRTYKHRMLNIHPALLPSFGGKGFYGHRVHEAAIEYGVRWTGVTVHLVDEEYDTGPIVLQEPVPVRQEDTPESLAARVLKKEHRLYPEALRLFAENRVTIKGRRVIIHDPLPRISN